jgi:hypothetical protein
MRTVSCSSSSAKGTPQREEEKEGTLSSASDDNAVARTESLSSLPRALPIALSREHSRRLYKVEEEEEQQHYILISIPISLFFGSLFDFRPAVLYLVPLIIPVSTLCEVFLLIPDLRFCSVGVASLECFADRITEPIPSF